MPSLRGLSAVSAVSLSIFLVMGSADVHAQNIAAPPAVSAPAQIPPLAVPILPPLSTSQSAPQLPLPSTTFRLPPLSPNAIHRLETLNAQRLPLLARNEGPCYTLRTYGFTAGQDPAEAPHLSSHTTCTPASQSHAKVIVLAPPGR